jgi:lipopolysaccharide transport protein LptA
MKHHHPLRILFFLLLAVAMVAIVSAQGFGPLASPFGPVSSSPDNSSPTPSTEPNIAPDQRPKDAKTVIESDAGATFDNAKNTAEFTGHVVVHDPQFDLSCDKLHVILGQDRKGLSKVIASGSVVITQLKKNDRGDIIKSVGRCGKATYDAPTGDVTMEDWPQIQQGINNQVATQQSTVMILNAKGRSRTIGGSRTMIVDQGDKALTP